MSASQHHLGLRFTVHLDIYYLWQLSGNEQVDSIKIMLLHRSGEKWLMLKSYSKLLFPMH